MEKNPSGSEALKKMIPQLLISFSLFSLAVSYSSLFNSFTASSSSLLYPSSKFHHYFSATSFRLLSKNCLFLICNGLLVFLSKTSGLIQPPSAHDLDDLLQLSPVADTTPLHKSEPDENSGGAGQISIFIAESEEERAEAGLDSDKEDVESDGCWLFDDEAEQVYGEEDEDSEGEGEDEDEDEKSTEELNQKFEEFIRKMKEEIIINEARHKVLMLK